MFWYILAAVGGFVLGVLICISVFAAMLLRAVRNIG